MMKKQNKKRGFTIIELVIVVTVIAILSAVLIPTFAGIIKRSKQSADETAVRNLNTVIATADKEIDTVDDLVAFLESENIAMDSYVPMSKGYSFVWSDAENMVMLYSEKDKEIVFPAAYAGKDVAFVTIVTDKEEKPVEATDANAFANNAIVAVKNDLAVATSIAIEKDLIVDLSATVSTPNITDDADSNGVFWVKDGILTLNGNGTVNAKTQSNYNMAVWANGGSVVINGGYYTNEGAKATEDDGTPNNNELIYVNGGQITINGGTFKCENEDWTLNAKDDVPGAIIVKGGEFFEFDPSNELKVRTTNATKNGIVIPEGYKVVKVEKEDGNWYKVVKE